MTAPFDPVAKEQALRAESAAWDIATPAPARPGDVPTVDVGPWFAAGRPADLDAAADALRVASEEVGFFRLIGHGIPAAETDAILGTARRFHALPLATKQLVLMDGPHWPVSGVGYLPVGHRKLPRRDTGNRNEAFLVKLDRHLDFDANQWLPEDELPGFRAAVERYAGLITDLALKLLPVYGVALGLSPDFFAPAFEHPFRRLRLTRYPPTDRVADDGHGIAPHVDTTFFTLLLQDGPGLAIFSHLRQCWIRVQPVDDALVVNSGELLRQWSNDRVLSTRHFADNPLERDRYAVPFFFNATADHPMECLPSCHGPNNPPKYPTISYLESQGVVQGE